jgi:hypothetical protein
VAVVLWVAGCVGASVWQVGRAIQGHTLSDLYSFEWPIFAVLGVVGWWSLLHVDDTTEIRPAEREVVEELHRTEAALARDIDRDDEDATLREYNDHLEQLADQPKKRLFGH